MTSSVGFYSECREAWRLVRATSTGYILSARRGCCWGVKFVKVAAQPASNNGRQETNSIFFNISR